MFTMLFWFGVLVTAGAFGAGGYKVGFGEGVRYNARKWRENVKAGAWKEWSR